MFQFKTLAEWHKFATSGSQPVIVENNDKEWVVYHRDGREIQPKPENWKAVMAVVNCPNRAPIPASLKFEIQELIDPKLEIDIWNPWPTLTKLKNDGALQMTLSLHDASTLILKNTITTKCVCIYNAGAIVAKWDRMGFEHDDLLWFAVALSPLFANKVDPWLGLMQWKACNGVELGNGFFNDVTIIINGRVDARPSFPSGFKVKELVQLFNDGDVPPGCVTAWEPYYTADEALPLLEKAYGTPEFATLIARFRNGKLRRSP